MIDFFMNNINALLIAGKCDVLGAEFTKILKDIFMWIEIAVPCIIVALCSVDMVKAVTSQDEKGMKDAQSNVVKRLIIGVVIFFIPLVIDVLLDLAGIATGVCSIGG